MKTSKFPYILGFLILSFWISEASTAQAKIIWESTEQTMIARPNDATIATVFKFRNQGPRKLEILDTIPSCHCTSALPNQRVYEPNEVGTIKAIFNVGNMPGNVKQDIVVRTNDPDAPLTILSLIISIEYTVKMSSTLLNWNISQTPESKSITLTPNYKYGVKILSASSLDPNIQVHLNPPLANGSVRLDVIPLSTAEEEIAPILVNTNITKPNTKIMAYAMINKRKEYDTQ